eukprot:361982-Chlamydomonas_euryale.AAC.7
MQQHITKFCCHDMSQPWWVLAFRRGGLTHWFIPVVDSWSWIYLSTPKLLACCNHLWAWPDMDPSPHRPWNTLVWPCQPAEKIKMYAGCPCCSMGKTSCGSKIS